MRAGLELLKGSLGAAQAANPTSLEISAMIRIYTQDTARVMKYMVPDDPDGARALYDNALKILKGGLEFDSIHSELSAILSQ